MITQNLQAVRERIAGAAKRAGRNPEDVLLVAVSKTKPVSMIEEAIAAEQFVFGENKPQELRDKYDVLKECPHMLSWHMIGHLQRNKVKYVVGRAVMIHSVDSVELAQAISDEAVKKQLIMPVLIEVNIAAEESKFGLRPEDTEAFVRQISTLPGLKVQGLMTIAPIAANPEDNRLYFRNLKDLSIDIAQKNIDNVSMSELSMGMTDDFEVAVEEGATIVRVGTGIFGVRNYAV